jgi:hypothetical protein
MSGRDRIGSAGVSNVDDFAGTESPRWQGEVDGGGDGDVCAA